MPGTISRAPQNRGSYGFTMTGGPGYDMSGGIGAIPWCVYGCARKRLSGTAERWGLEF